MNKLLLVLLAFCTQAHAALIPFGPSEEARIAAIENKKILKVVYDVSSSQGGASAAAISLGQGLPSGAIIVRDYFQVNTAFAGTGATVALSCQNANNIFSAAGINTYSAGNLIDGVSTGASTVFKRITADCPIQATVGTADLSAGKLTLWVEYVLGL